MNKIATPLDCKAARGLGQDLDQLVKTESMNDDVRSKDAVHNGTLLVQSSQTTCDKPFRAT